MKTYVITFSTHFPTTHPRAGEPTHFVEKIAKGEKKHTIRANSDLWIKRIGEVIHGEAELSLRYWSGKPYKSPQVEFGKVTKDDKPNVQLMFFREENIYRPAVYYSVEPKNWIGLKAEAVANHDGLSLEDWIDWFKGYDITKPLAIINLGNWRY